MDPAKVLIDAVQEAKNQYRASGNRRAFDRAMQHRIPRLLALLPPNSRAQAYAWIQKQQARDPVPKRARGNNDAARQTRARSR